MFAGRQIVNREAKKKLATSDAERAHDRQLVNAGQENRSRQGEATQSEPQRSETQRSETQWDSEHGEADTEVFSAVDSDGKPRLDKRGRHGSADGS